MKRSGTLFLVVGPSGAGKDTLIAAAKRRLAPQEFAFPKRTITRANDPDGEDHEAADQPTFVRRDAAGEFALSWRAHGLSYGIPAAIARDLEQGKNVVVNVSRTTLERARARFASVKVIAITAPEAVRTKRLRARGREAHSEIESRAARDVHHLADVTIANDGSVELAIEAFLAALHH